jgi:EpsI family protein
MKRPIIVSVLLLVIGVAAHALRPTALYSDSRAPIELAQDIPRQTPSWTRQPNTGQVVENPQVSEFIKQVYSQTQSEVYTSPNKPAVMLSLAYSTTQGDQTGVHYPEVCYPAQGFSITKSSISQEQISGKSTPIKWVETKKGSRDELVAYFIMVGDTRAVGGYKVKLAQIPYTLSGYVPDATLIRFSLLGQDSQLNRSILLNFINEFIANTKGGLHERWLTGPA